MRSDFETAVKILKNTYWSSKGWKDDRKISKEDLAFATKAGVMFPPEFLPHDKVIKETHSLCDKIADQDVGDAFLASLSTQNVAARSALASYVIATERGVHSFKSGRLSTSHLCAICGAEKNPKEKEDLNVLSFERHKWGGVRHDNPEFQYLDLRCFLDMPKAVPTKDDIRMFKDLLKAIKQMPPKTWASSLVTAISSDIPGSKSELRTLLEILGWAGILVPPGYRSSGDFDTPEDRPYRDTDWSGPIEMWQTRDGYNVEKVRRFFPSCLEK